MRLAAALLQFTDAPSFAHGTDDGLSSVQVVSVSPAVVGKAAVVAGTDLGSISKIGMGSTLGFRNDLRIIGAQSTIGASFHTVGGIGESAKVGDKAETSTIWLIVEANASVGSRDPPWN